MKHLLITALLLLSATLGRCAIDQAQVERHTAWRLSSYFSIRHKENPLTVISNLPQLLGVTNNDYLSRFEAHFERFGTNRGFENSILEKYVFMPRGVTADDQIGGEVLMVGAQSFPGPDGEPMRSVVAESGNMYRGFITSDARLAKWTAKAGVEIPKPVPSAKIPKPTGEMTAEEWDRENRHWIDPILDAALNSNSKNSSALEHGRSLQARVENRMVGRLAIFCESVVERHPGIIFSNLFQILPETNNAYLFAIQESFMRFGTNRGFEHSILEKYVFPPPGIVADDGLGGDLVFIAAKGFPGPDGQMMRAGVARSPNSFRGLLATEARLTKWTSKAGVEIPEPSPGEPLVQPEKPMTAEEWDRENRHWIDPILDAALNSNSPPSSATHTGPRGTAPATASASSKESSQTEPASLPPNRNPRWAMLGVGMVLAMAISSAWWIKRR